MNKRLAFTLIELLVVIAVIGILSGLIVVSMNGVTNKATMAKAQVFSNSLRNSLMANLVSEWKFDGSTADGSSATANDIIDSWSTNNGVYNATHTPVVKTGNNCVNGSCLQFNGTTNYVDIGTTGSATSGGEMSVFAWIKVSNTIPDATRVGNIIGNFGYNPHFNLEAHTSGRLRFYWNAGEKDFYSLNFDMRDNKWHYVGMTRKLSVDTNIGRIYIDGVINNSSTAGTSIDIQWPLRIGDDFRSGTNSGIPFNGLMDDVRLYNAAVPTSQVKENYFAGLYNLLISKQISQNEYVERINFVAKR